MKNKINWTEIFGYTLIIAGIILGIYMGLWVCLIGGIVDIARELNAAIQAKSDLNGQAIGWGVVKIFFAGVVGWTSALLLIIPGIRKL